jgi:hypothetical protein
MKLTSLLPEMGLIYTQQIPVIDNVTAQESKVLKILKNQPTPAAGTYNRLTEAPAAVRSLMFVNSVM